MRLGAYCVFEREPLAPFGSTRSCRPQSAAISKLPAHCRFKFGPRWRQWNLCDLIGVRRLGRIAHLPLAHSEAAVRPLLQVHVHMILVIAVRAGTEHRGEASACVLSHSFAKIPCDLRI